MRRPHLALSAGAAALAAALAAAELRAQSAPARSATASANPNPMAAARGARSLLRNGADYIDYGEPERALELLREAEARQFELTPDERTQLNRAIVRARQAIRAGDAPGTRAPVTVRTARSRRAGSIVLNTPPPMPPLPTAPTATEPEPQPAPELIQLTSGTRVEAPAPAPAAPAPLLTPTPEPAPTSAEPPPPSSRLADDPAPLPLLEATPETFQEEPAAPVAATEPVPIETVAPEPAPVETVAPEPAPVETVAPEPAPVETVAPEPAPESAPAAMPSELPPLPTQVSAPPAPSGGLPALAVEASDPLAPDPVTPDAPAAEAAPAPVPEAAPVAEVPVVPEVPIVPEMPVVPEAAMPVPDGISEAEAAILSTPAPLSSTPALEPEPVPVMEAEAPPAPVQDTVASDPVETAEEAPLPPPAEEVVVPGAPPVEDLAAPVEDQPTSAPSMPLLPAEPDRSPLLDTGTAPARGESLLSPETRREVEELARRQRIDMRGGSQSEPRGLERPGIGLPGGLRGAGETRPSSLPPLPRDAAGDYDLGLGGGYGSSQPAESRIELPRPPSPTEPRPIRSIPVPEEFVPHAGRNWAPSRKVWAAAATCHGPLYFQDAVLERYGQTAEQALGPAGRFLTYPIDDPNESNLRMQMIQPLYSIGKFSAQIATWPVRLVLDPPWEAEYDLGYYRPGDRIPPDTWYFPEHGVGPPLQGRNY